MSLSITTQSGDFKRYFPKAEALREENRHQLDVLSLSQQEIYATSTWKVKNNSQIFMLEFDVLFFQTLFLKEKVHAFT